MDNESIDDISRLSFAGEGGFEWFELMHENGDGRIGTFTPYMCH